MGAFGYSIGDILTAIKIIHNIIDEFRKAKKKYAISCGFLQQLVPVLRRMQAQLDEAPNEELQEDVAAQHAAIGAAYEEFDKYLSKKYNGLSAKEPSKARALLQRVNWTLDELDHKVQGLKDRMTEALQPYQTFMLQELHSRVIDLTEDYRSNASSTTEENEKRFQEVKTTLVEIQELSQVIHQERLGYKEAAAEQKQQAADDTAAIRGDISEMRTEMKSETQARDEIQTLKLDEHATEQQAQLQRTEDKLLALVAEQRERADSKDEADRWRIMEERAEKQAEKQEAEQEQAQQHLETQVKDAANLLRAGGTLTENKHMNKYAEKVEVLGPLGKWGKKLFGGSNEAESRKAASGSGTATSSMNGTRLERNAVASRTAPMGGLPSTSPRSVMPPPQAKSVRASTAGPTVSQPRQQPSHQAQRLAPKPPPPMPTTPPPQRYQRSVSTPPNANYGPSRGLPARVMTVPPTRLTVCSGISKLTPQGPACDCEIRRDSFTSTVSTASTNPGSLDRPSLPARPHSDIMASHVKSSSRPPLPPRSSRVAVAARSQDTASSLQLLRTPSTMSLQPTTPPSILEPGMRRPSAADAVTLHRAISPKAIPPSHSQSLQAISLTNTPSASSLPGLTRSPTTDTTASSPTTPTSNSSGSFVETNPRVVKWVTTTPVAVKDNNIEAVGNTTSIEMEVFERSAESTSGGMSVSQRRNLFEGSPIMGRKA